MLIIKFPHLSVSGLLLITALTNLLLVSEEVTGNMEVIEQTS